MIRWLLLFVIVLVGGAASAAVLAPEVLKEKASSCLQTSSFVLAGLAPEVPKAKGGSCVRNIPFMRKKHMELLYHQRDLTMYKGERPKKERLNSCISCHAVNDAHGKPVTYEDPKHFCRTCHEFAAVKVDCFECHSSVPDEKTASGGAK